jgi:CHAT domain-containing protein
VLDGLQRHQFASVAYHGKLTTGKPFEAAMWFPNGECLTLLDIVRSRHPAGESALLPGARTAELTDGSIPDEALHLSAAVQFSGFRSVIGTMWGVGDEDGQSFAEAVLQSMFSGRDRGEAHYERSARALQHAVQQMRQRDIPLSRWVNYVHHGA